METLFVNYKIIERINNSLNTKRRVCDIDQGS